ncbi:hypothetical protein ACO9S2_16060 [Nitrospira sp. NS4]|uniref:hypothetical protein n=1 Tax=Nitrospira sp. NS4 TaxID=3414498 RepID=UPI003C2D6777
MRCLSFLLSAVMLAAGPALAAEEVSGVGPLQIRSVREFAKTLANDIRFLDDPASIESFLAALDGEPPDWPTVYGQGHHDPGHDERLFNLNRARDAKREGNPALQTRIAFVWSGELSRFDPETGGYSIALGPVFTATRWGVVRFKPEDLPGELRAVPDPEQAVRVKGLMDRGEPVEPAVLFIGRLIPGESLVYDFSHDEGGLGLIMPFVRIEQVHYVWDR